MFHRITRRGICAIILTFLLMALTCSTLIISKVQAASTLGAAAAASGRIFGAAVASGHLGESQYVSTLDTQFTGVTPENEMKWDTTEPSQGSFNFGPADTIVSHAQSHNMKIRGHTLVWHNQLPGWVSSLSGSAVLSAMQNHIQNEVTHFKGKIWYWDVVNEALNEDGSHRSDVFQNQIGNAYIQDAFIAAHNADPNAKLCYNDYNIESINAKSNAVYSMVQSFKASGVPIDCVGFQTHLTVGQVPSDYQANLQRFAALGVDVNITELDDNANSGALQQEATDYSEVVSACLAVSRCTDITTWGITDQYSWRGASAVALLFDSNYNPKPAFTSTLQALNSATGGVTPTPVPTTPVPTTPVSNPTPTPTPPTGGASCQVSYSVNQWQGGFTANMTVKNTSSTAINGWSLTFTFPASQQVTQGWNGVFSQSGANVTITNASYNGAIAAGGSVNPGFNGSWSGSNPSPTSFKLNGATCTTA